MTDRDKLISTLRQKLRTKHGNPYGVFKAAEAVVNAGNAIYPHMCRMDHVEIGHSDNSSEMCPLCRAIAEVHRSQDKYGEARMHKAKNPLDPEPSSG